VRTPTTFGPRRSTVSPIVGGVAAISYPAVLVVVALSVGFRRGGDVGEFAATLAATLLFLIAAPTAWILSFPFIEVTRFTVVVFGVATALPLWYLLGVAIARRSEGWPSWLRLYALVCVVWTAMNLIGVGIVASLSG
jgi:hypothetical protein